MSDHSPSSRPSSGESARAAAPRSPPWPRRPRGRRLYRPAALSAALKARPAIVTSMLVTRTAGVPIVSRAIVAVCAGRCGGGGGGGRELCIVDFCLFIGTGEATPGCLGANGYREYTSGLWYMSYPGRNDHDTIHIAVPVSNQGLPIVPNHQKHTEDKARKVLTQPPIS